MEPHQNVIRAIQRLSKEQSRIEIFVLSAVLSDSRYALAEKNNWLERYLPEIDDKHRLFPACGENKSICVREHVNHGPEPKYLLDDYTKNLKEWGRMEKGIKLVNQINHLKGEWTGNAISYLRNDISIANALLACFSGKVIRDQNLKAKIPYKNCEMEP